MSPRRKKRRRPRRRRTTESGGVKNQSQRRDAVASWTNRTPPSRRWRGSSMRHYTRDVEQDFRREGRRRTARSRSPPAPRPPRKNGRART